jgi:CheY-like chemotaxis protein
VTVTPTSDRIADFERREAAVRQSSAAPRHTVRAMSERTVLVIDDQPDILDVVRLAIEVTTDWEVLTAASTAEALDVLAAATADAILLDLSVTGDDAAGAVAQLGDAGDGTPVLLLTAMTLAASEVASTGANGFIAKPFDPMSLADDIGELLGWG